MGFRQFGDTALMTGILTGIHDGLEHVVRFSVASILAIADSDVPVAGVADNTHMADAHHARAEGDVR